MGKNKKKPIFWVVYLAILIAFCTAGVLLLMRANQREQGSSFYDHLAGKERASALSSVSAEAGPDVAASPGSASAPETTPGELSLSARLGQVRRAYPETVAWLQIPGTPINYPVMQGEDNDFYLKHLPDGTENYLGSIFLDYEVELSDRHLILYGHNTSEEMFGLLKEYESQTYYEAHPNVLFCAGEETWECPIFSVRRVAPGSDAYVLDFNSDLDFGRYVDGAARQSLYPIEADSFWAERVLTLSTCTEQDGERLIVQALLPKGHSNKKGE